MSDERSARFLWLPRLMRPPVTLPRQQEIVFLLVGTTMLFSGYDLAVYSLALPQIQHALNIPENAVGLTVSLFRLAAFATLFIAPFADVFGRRRLLLVTVFGEALFTVATAFVQTQDQFIAVQMLARVFGYCEEALCFVVIAEEIDERVRGWSIGTLGAMNGTGAGLSSLVFALVNVLPYGWRALYVIGGGTLLILAYFRRWLPETARFQRRQAEIGRLESKATATLVALRGLVRDHPGRLAAMSIAVFANGFGIAPAVILSSKYLQEVYRYQPHQITLLFVFGGFFSVLGNVLAGRFSDRLGRKRVLIVSVLVSAIFFYLLYGGAGATLAAVAWIVAVFGYLAADALFAGFPAEIFPTAYRATASTVRYVVAIAGGALSLALESLLYDRLGGHGPAISLMLLSLPVAAIAVLFLPEPARRKLEEISGDVAG